MRIGFVLPEEILDEIISFAKSEFPQITPIPISYKSISELPPLLQGMQRRVDVMLFLGNTARRYAEKTVLHRGEWLTIPRSSSALLRILFRAVVKGYKMRIATDLDNKEFFRIALHETGLSKEDFSVEIIPFFPYNEGLLLRDANKMEKLYRDGKVDFCITIFYKVRDILKERNVPVYILQPSYDDIHQGLQRLLLSHELGLYKDNQVAIAIHIDPLKNELPDHSDYHITLERLQVRKEIHRFAHLLKGASIEQPPEGHYIFTSPAMLETVTDHFNRFPLLETINETTAFTLSVGIGYGENLEQAKYNAGSAMQRAIRQGGNKAYLIGKELSIKVPMINATEDSHKEERPIDEQFLYLSQKSGLSQRIIMKLFHACRDSGKQRFTSQELAGHIGVSPRTMNRIIAKLIDHHLAQDVGRHSTEKTGRPSRIIEILFETKRHNTKPFNT